MCFVLFRPRINNERFYTCILELKMKVTLCVRTRVCILAETFFLQQLHANNYSPTLTALYRFFDLLETKGRKRQEMRGEKLGLIGINLEQGLKVHKV